MIILHQLVRGSDGGPIYTETDFSRFVVEPWNGVSAALFLLIVIYWITKLKGHWKERWFLSACVGILTIGGIGGTLYHAFRVSQVFLLMDWVPILILCLAGSGYFFYLYQRKWWGPFIWLSGAFLIMGANYTLSRNLASLPEQFSINFGYFLMALTILVPTYLLLNKTHFKAAKWVLYALIAFALALFFRISDGWGLLPMGTHFLWHAFGAFAAHNMLMYLYEVEEIAIA
ncbi:MAG: hypothetical protein AAFR87_11950 [Bacteroidota bacterium]